MKQFGQVLDNADAVIDGNWPAAHNMCFWAVKAPNIAAVDSGTRGPICSFLQSTFDKFSSLINQKCYRRSPMSYWKVIMSVRLSVGALGFKGWFVMLPLR